MENATKALLIAAAVLVAIIIISLGVAIVSGARDQINKSSDALDDAEVEAFNSKFSSYEGGNVSGTRVKTLVKTAYQQNLKEEDESRRVTVKLEGSKENNGTLISTDEKNLKDNSQSINTGSRYSVKFETKKSGMIETIILTELSNNSNSGNGGSNN